MCKSDNIDLFNSYLEQFRYEKDYTPFNSTFVCHLKKYTAFVLIKFDNEILDYKSFYIRYNSDIDKLKKIIKNKLEYIAEKDLEHISIKYVVIEQEEDTDVLLKYFEKEFYNLDNLFNNKRKKIDFDKLSNLILSKTHYFIIVTTFILTVIVANRLTSIGILADQISFDSLALVTNITITNVIKVFLLIGLASFIYIFIISLIAYMFDRVARYNYKEKLISTFRFLSVILIFIYSLIIALESIDYKKFGIELTSYITNLYIDKTRIPSIRTVKIDNKELDILFMGKDNKVIYYLKDDYINKVLRNTNNTICEDNKNDKISYSESLMKLLHIKGNKIKVSSPKDEKTREKYKDIFIIGNQRKDIIQISKVSFIGKPSFEDAFCKKEFEEAKK